MKSGATAAHARDQERTNSEEVRTATTRPATSTPEILLYRYTGIGRRRPTLAAGSLRHREYRIAKRRHEGQRPPREQTADRVEPVAESQERVKRDPEHGERKQGQQRPDGSAQHGRDDRRHYRCRTDGTQSLLHRKHVLRS